MMMIHRKSVQRDPAQDPSRQGLSALTDPQQPQDPLEEPLQ